MAREIVFIHSKGLGVELNTVHREIQLAFKSVS
jgi:hypothetical protein